MSTPASTTQREPMSPTRRLVLVLGGVFAALAIAWGALSLVALLVGQSSSPAERIVLTPQQQRLHVELTSGDITLHRGNGPDVVVLRTTRSGFRSPETSEVSDADGVRIEASCPGPFNWYCGASYDIALPDGFAVELVSSSGDENVRDLTVGSLRAEVSSGAVRLANVTGPVRLGTSSGDIRAEGVRSDTASAHTSSGEILLAFDAAPSRVDAEASSGDVRVRLPEGVYRVLTDTSSGEVRVDVPTDPGSQRVVDARTSSGDVTVDRAGG